jgi:predicted AAA+ superfamily ATPase
MLRISDVEVRHRLDIDNPWWADPAPPQRVKDWKERLYLPLLFNLVERTTPNRASIVMGPRRVGKTVMLIQTVYKLIASGVAPQAICYAAVDNPVYTGRSLDKLLELFMQAHGHKRRARLYVLFDEIQYVSDWERHLKSLVDTYPDIRFVASGSAAAALKRKSDESGAGRFTDFMVPPLSFVEFLQFRGLEPSLLADSKIDEELLAYMNYGGFPEATVDESVQRSMSQFVANDIIDKVLLRDLPSLYGIGDPQELKRFFSFLAYNTGEEVNVDGLSRETGIAKNTLRKHIEYLEAAFLIRLLYRVDFSSKTFSRHSRFKIYLTNPSMRAALYGEPSSDSMGRLVETTVACQLLSGQRANYRFNYVRETSGRIGEVDFVAFRAGRERPVDALEVKWTDRPLATFSRDLGGLVHYANRAGLKRAYVLKRGQYESLKVEGIDIHVIPVQDFLVSEGSFTLSQESTRRASPADGPSETVRRIAPWARETFGRKPGVPWPLG